MAFAEEDLSTAARIRYAALESFAAKGVDATTFRDIADAAGVSSGSVQHYFKSKDGIRTAVNEHVARRLTDTLRVEGAPDGDVARHVGDRITALVRDERFVLLYLVRATADGDEAALQVFDELVASADHQLGRLVGAGLLREDLDRRWAVLHVIIINLATVLLESAITRHLDAPLLEPAQLERWNRASTALFRSGIFRQKK